MENRKNHWFLLECIALEIMDYWIFFCLILRDQMNDLKWSIYLWIFLNCSLKIAHKDIVKQMIINKVIQLISLLIETFEDDD
jgi:hypothetical protein